MPALCAGIRMIRGFAQLNQVVAVMSQQAERVIESGVI